MSRRTLRLIEFYPTPKEIFDMATQGQGWPYKWQPEYYLKRDRALASILYLLALRISEALRLRKNQFLFPEETGQQDRVIVRGIKLSKPRRKTTERKDEYRQEGWLPLTGPREPLTRLVLDWLEELHDPEARVFPIVRSRAYQVVVPLTGYPLHYLRAWGENYLYDNWGKDLLAVSDYVKVEARTLQHYIRRGYEKYGAV